MYREAGYAGGDSVEILATPFRADTVEVTYKANDAVDQTVVYGSSESEL